MATKEQIAHCPAISRVVFCTPMPGIDEFYRDGDQSLRQPTKAHNSKPVNIAEGVLVDTEQS